MSSTANTERRGPGYLTSILTFVVVLALVFAGFLYGRARAHRGLYAALESQGKKTELVSSMLADLHASAEAEKAAVMAETDEASRALSEEARQASSRLEQSRVELERLVQRGNRPDEKAALQEFNQTWKSYRDLEREILELAVENTNLKAQRLSFGAARDALSDMEAALGRLREQAESRSDADSIRRLASEAFVAALKIYALHARHIAEPQDAEMDRIEAQMKTLDLEVTDRLSALSRLSTDASGADIQDAQQAYATFQKVQAEILSLSRRNSNVRSAALALGRKRNTTAACRDSLESLRKAVEAEGPRATR
jgi:hypothetical protein